MTTTLLVFIIGSYMFLHGFVAIFLVINDYGLIVYPDEFYWGTNLNWFGAISVYILYCIFCPVFALGTFLHWIATK